MFDKLKKAARSMVKEAPKLASKVSEEAPKLASKIEPYTTKAAERARPYADKVAAVTKQKLSKANKMARSPSEVKKHLSSPVQKIAKSTRNWSIGIAFVGIAIFGFSYGLGSSIIPSVSKVIGSSSSGD